LAFGWCQYAIEDTGLIIFDEAFLLVQMLGAGNSFV
jgi:hypothetical protein